MRTLIFGSKGQLGRDLMAVFGREGEAHGYDLPETDITDDTTLQPLADLFRPTLIINAAAYTDVEGAEDDLENAYLVNETGARNVADVARFFDVPVVYYSTDYVFDGTKKAPYTPEDAVAPVSVYGKSKAAGEAATRRANHRHFILRTAWLYGPGGNNFVEKIMKLAADRPEIQVVNDETGSPTHTWDLAEATLALARGEAWGTYHAVNAGSCTRFELAQEILRLAGLKTDVTPCGSDAFPAKAARPGYSVLDTAVLESVSGHRMRDWREALADYMRRRG
jgi:dTDP-4-dehydrorhamnose reductase